MGLYVARKRVLEISKEMSYIPNSIARSLSTKKSDTIGVKLLISQIPFSQKWQELLRMRQRD